MKKELGGDGSASAVGGLAGGLLTWFRGRLRGGPGSAPRLAVIERIALGPRQSLALVEADGRRLLLATSPEGMPAFYPLDEPAKQAKPGATSRTSGLGPVRRATADRDARVSW